MRISMRALLITAIISIAIAGSASASSVVQQVDAIAASHARSVSAEQHAASVINRVFAQQVRSRLSLGNGLHVLNTSVRCAPAYDGTGGWICQGQFTASGAGYSALIDCIIKANHSGTTWHETGKPWVVRSW